MSSLPLTPPPASAALRARTPGVTRLVESMSRGVRLGLTVSVRKRVLLLGLVGLTLTLSLAGAAWVCLVEVTATNQRLAEVNRAQRFHQDADMMHDALHADVVRARQLGTEEDAAAEELLRRDTTSHAQLFRGDIEASLDLRLPGPVAQALADLRPAQARYIGNAQAAVDALLLGRPDGLEAQTQVESAFRVLADRQAEVTELLAQTAVRAEQAAEVDRDQAITRLALASTAALAGWFVLLLWQQRSMGRLHGALLREAEHRSASDVLQRSLLPEHLPHVPGLELAARSLPGDGNRIGGDWYDVIPLPTGHVGLVVGDVLGHDLAAASAMGQLRNALRAYALDDPSPASVLSRLNRAVDLLDVVELATCLYAVLDPSTLRIVWASAGHLAPLVSTPEGQGHILAADPGPPLGAVPGAEYADHDLLLSHGESLALYTDGLVERRGASIDVGLGHLVAVKGCYDSADDMCDRLLAGLIGQDEHNDDVTLLVVHALAESRQNVHVA
jgi:serine phosphatase RsbU (regulator of sigma subunit)